MLYLTALSPLSLLGFHWGSEGLPGTIFRSWVAGGGAQEGRPSALAPNYHS